MTVLLLLLTFGAFILLDAWANRRKTAKTTGTVHSLPVPPVEPVWVAGYELPEPLYYHPGHTWVHVLDGDTVAVGMDDFARRLLGSARAVDLPAVGSWLEQGERGFGVKADGRAADLLAPATGEVVAVNENLRGRPDLATQDPYGRGWVMKLRSPRLAANLRNLLSGAVARSWIEGARTSLDLRLMALSGSVLQDGGEPVAEFAKHVSDEDWRRLVSEFLLT